MTKKNKKKKTYRLLSANEHDKILSIREDYSLKEAMKLAKACNESLHAPEEHHVVQEWNGKKWTNILLNRDGTYGTCRH